MDCQVCGMQLPAEAKACPNCGTLTPAYYTNAGASPYDPTTPAVSGSSPSVMSAPPPPTQYGSNPYDMPLQSPYHVNPYEALPPPPPQRPGNRIGIIVGVVILVLILIGGGVFAWLAYSSARNAAAATAQATATAQAIATAQATATAQAIATATANFTAKGTFTILSRTNISVRQDGQNRIYSYTQQEVDYGDVTGSLTVEETSIVHPDNTANFSGTSTCTCTVAGKSGTLIYSYTGTSTANGSFQGQTFDGHGTGDLAKLHGQGTFQGQGLHGTYSSELHFDA
jgi:type II secretory pathway pseudopilin PulG